MMNDYTMINNPDEKKDVNTTNSAAKEKSSTPALNFNLFDMISDDENLNESVSTEELRAAKKKLPDWDLYPPEGYMNSMK